MSALRSSFQEAFKAVEDIHAFTTISKKTPRPPQLASYYSKVALVFWKAGNYVFHATTVLKLYVLHREQKKNITHAELSRLSTKARRHLALNTSSIVIFISFSALHPLDSVTDTAHANR